MLEILGQNRDLEQQLKETKNMLTQIDVSRLPSYQWGREDTLKEFQAELAEKDVALQEKDNLLQKTLQEKQSALQEKQQQTVRLARKMHLSGMDTAQIADLLEMPLAEVVALFKND